jgi:hypothetical protein
MRTRIRFLLLLPILILLALAPSILAQSLTNTNGTVFKTIAPAEVPVGGFAAVTFTDLGNGRVRVQAPAPANQTWVIQCNVVDPSVAAEWFTVPSSVQANGVVSYDAAIPRAGAAPRYWRAARKADRAAVHLGPSLPSFASRDTFPSQHGRAPFAEPAAPLPASHLSREWVHRPAVATYDRSLEAVATTRRTTAPANLTSHFALQGRAVAARVAHNHEVDGAIPSPATSFKRTPNQSTSERRGGGPRDSWALVESLSVNASDSEALGTGRQVSGASATSHFSPLTSHFRPLLAVVGMPLLAQAGPTTNATVNAIAETVTSVGTPFIVKFAANNPWLCTILLVIGALRFVLKPIVAALHAWAASTEDTRDDEMVARVERSTAWKWALFVIDWLGSIKPPPKKQN